MALSLHLAPEEVETNIDETGSTSGVDILESETVGDGVEETTEEDDSETEESDQEESEEEETADDPTEITSDEPPPPSNIMGEIAQAEEICKSKEAVVNNLKEMLKDAKTNFDAAVNRLRKLCASLANDDDRPLLKVAEAASSTALDGQPVSATGIASPSFDWHSVSILELTNCDLSPAIAQRLKDAQIETIGELEDLRLEISMGSASWPKGIGAAKITAIEEAVVKWLAANRDRIGETSSVEVSPPIEEAEAEGAVEVDAATDSSPPKFDAQKHWKGWREWDEEKYAKKLVQWAAIIAAGPLACQEPEYQDIWEEGFKAFNNNEKLESCEITPNTEDIDEWIRGWLSAQVEEREAVKAEKVEEGSAEEYKQDTRQIDEPIESYHAKPDPIPELDDDDFDL